MKIFLNLSFSMLFGLMMLEYTFANDKYPSVLISGMLEGSNNSIPLSKEITSINNGENNLSGVYNLIADISFKTVKQQKIFNYLPLLMKEGNKEPFIIPKDKEQIVELSTLKQPNKSQERFYKKQDLSVLGNYYELWVDYQD